MINALLFSEQHQAVVITLLRLLGDDNAGEKLAIPFNRLLGDGFDQRRLNTFRVPGQGRFRPDDQVVIPEPTGFAPVDIENILPLFITPLQFLGDVSLHYGDLKRFILRLGPLLVL